jgi:hypothetical protein
MQRLGGILGVVIGVSIAGYILLNKLQHGGILGLLGYETMTAVHTFVVKSPDGRITSQVREHMDGNDASSVMNSIPIEPSWYWRISRTRSLQALNRSRQAHSLALTPWLLCRNFGPCC